MEGRAVGGADLAGVLNVIFLIMLISTWKAALAPLMRNFNFFAVETPSPNALMVTANPEFLGLAVSGSSSATSTPTPSSVLAVSMPTLQPTQTPYPTYTPYPEPTPTVGSIVGSGAPMAFRFSYYDPLIGRDMIDIAEVNCFDWNYETNYCDSKLHDWVDFEPYYGIGLACPEWLPMYSRLVVVSPNWLVGTYYCMDTGDLIVGDVIDFLHVWTECNFSWDETPWLNPFIAEVYPPVDLSEIPRRAGY
jgi:hypothetical protein